jgi:uncharacterized membrane-anchored protein YhcB (DUF1043 family)
MIDKMGREILPFIYDEIIYPHDDTLARVRLGDRRGNADRNGLIVWDIQDFGFLGYDTSRPFSEGFAAVGIDGKWGFIDRTGSVVVPIIYDGIVSFRDGFAAVCIDGKWGFVDTTGSVVVPIIYDGVWSFSESAEGLAGVRRDDRQGFVDKTGQEVIALNYDFFGRFSDDGFAVAHVGGKQGIIDINGREIIPPQYDEVYLFREGLAAVCLRQRWGFIDMNGEEVIPLKYDAVRNFSEGFAAVTLNGQQGFVNIRGQEVVSLKYDEVWCFSEGFALVMRDGKFGFIQNTAVNPTDMEFTEKLILSAIGTVLIVIIVVVSRSVIKAINKSKRGYEIPSDNCTSDSVKKSEYNSHNAVQIEDYLSAKGSKLNYELRDILVKIAKRLDILDTRYNNVQTSLVERFGVTAENYTNFSQPIESLCEYAANLIKSLLSKLRSCDSMELDNRISELMQENRIEEAEEYQKIGIECHEYANKALSTLDDFIIKLDKLNIEIMKSKDADMEKAMEVIRDLDETISNTKLYSD